MRSAASILLLLMLILPGLASARVEERSSLQAVHEMPASAARWPQDAPLLGSPDWSAISPPGTVLHPVEDEPWVQLQGSWHKGLPYPGHGLTSIRLISHTEAGGHYEAVASLRMNPFKGDANPLRKSFDNSAASMIRSAQIAAEQRTDSGYRLTEVRSPLGLTDPRDKENCKREFLGYRAELINPLSHPVPDGSPLYTAVNGELRVLRVVDGAHYLLTVEFASQDYPWAISLTENIARTVLTELAICDDGMCIPDLLPYGAEWYWPVAGPATLELLDESTADLIERPDSGIHPGHFPDLLEMRQGLPLRSLPGRKLRNRVPPAVESDTAWQPEPQNDNASAAPSILDPFSGWLEEETVQQEYFPNAVGVEIPERPESPAAPAETEDAAADPAEAVEVEIETPPAQEPQHDPVEDAIASMPDHSAQAPPAADPDRLPRLFEGWGSVRNSARPAGRNLLEPFAGWLHDDPGSIAADIARQLSREQRRGR